MSLKRMIDIYLEYWLDYDTYHMLWQMACHKIIKEETWARFVKITENWVLGGEHGQSVIDKRTGDVLYQMNEDGYLVKVKKGA